MFGGYCQLNSKGNNAEIVKENTVERFGYLSKHPSGNFFRISAIREYMDRKSDFLEKDPFSYDVYLAYCASLGNMMYYDKPCVCSMLGVLCKDDTRGSITYNKNAGNVYYFPENRISEFKTYVTCLNELKIKKSEKIYVMEKLYKQTLIFVTVQYRHIMNDPDICKYHHHKTEKIGIFKMIRFAANLRKAFYEIDCNDITKSDKRSIERQVLKSATNKILKKST